MHLYELFACFALILVHLCVLLSIFFYRFLVSIQNLDLDSEYVNVGIVKVYWQEFLMAHLNFWKEEKPTIPHFRLPRPWLLNRF